MREEIPFDNRAKASKFADQNHFPLRNGSSGNGKGSNGNLSKAKSSWGSQIVKGFSGEKKTKSQSSSSQGKKLPLTSSDVSNQKNSFGVSHSRVKRALIGDLSCSINAIQVHPHTVHQGSSKDLFLELDQLRRLLQESKEREFKLQAELSECERNSKVNDLERELELKKSEIDELVKKVESLESEKTSISQQLSSFNWFSDQQPEGLPKREEFRENLNGLEMEVVELRRLNKELQLQKRNLVCRLSSMETQLTSVVQVSETDVLEKIKAEASKLRHTNEDLCKQVEGLQMNRLNEVEELVYLRWVNSCLRNELRNISNMSSDRISSPCAPETPREPICVSSCRSDNDSGCSCMIRLNLIRKLKKWPINDEDLQQFKCQETFGNHNWDSSQNSVRRHSISGSKCCSEDIFLNKRRQSDGFIWSKEEGKEIQPLDPQNGSLRDMGKPQFSSSFQEASKLRVSFDVKKRALRIPNPPPRPSCTVSSIQKEQSSSQFPLRPPPPPPPPPKFMARNITGTVQRAPQVVEFYHSLMKRDTRKDSSGAGICDTSDVANVRSSMIGEIENRSSYLLAIKADVETQGEFVNSLIQEVNNAVYQDIEDVVAFVKWLDDELCFLVDERAVLKHFEWPEKKADTLREAAFGYRDLKKLEHEVTHYRDDPQLSCDAALKKITALSEKMERSVYNLLAMRDLLMRRCKEFRIPTEWMFDSGIISKIKFGSVKLAKIYMKRVAMELQFKGTSDKDSSMDYMLLQGVRFAFRIHQFAGGFDAETMRAFEELRNLALVLNKS